MTDYKAHANQPGYELDFERIYLAEHARCLELEKQLDALRDAARSALVALAYCSDKSIVEQAYEALQDELNKE